MTDRTAGGHAALMDATYRYQRRIYDLTRAWYLLGRDRLIRRLDPPEHGRVLEVACGTGRNLEHIGRRYPGRRLYGIDISNQMLMSAGAKLGNRVFLAQGDACHFAGEELFRTARFDRIVLSYAVSMIPDWQRAVRNAVRHLAPGGELHIVDFHDQSRLPSWFGEGLRRWLAEFHVTRRTELQEVCAAIAAEEGCAAEHVSLYRGYAQSAVIRRAPAGRRS